MLTKTFSNIILTDKDFQILEDMSSLLVAIKEDNTNNTELENVFDELHEQLFNTFTKHNSYTFYTKDGQEIEEIYA